MGSFGGEEAEEDAEGCGSGGGCRVVIGVVERELACVDS